MRTLAGLGLFLLPLTTHAQSVVVGNGASETVSTGGQVVSTLGFEVQSGATFTLAGTSQSNLAQFSGGATGASITLLSGGTLDAKFARFENVSTLAPASGATVARLHDCAFEDLAGWTPASAWIDLSALAAGDRAKLPFSFNRLKFVKQGSRVNVKAGSATPVVRLLGNQGSSNGWGESDDDDPYERVHWHVGAVTRSGGGTFDTLEDAIKDAGTTAASVLTVTLPGGGVVDDVIDWNACAGANATGPVVRNAGLAPMSGAAVQDGDAETTGQRGRLENCTVARGAVSETAADNCTFFDPSSGVMSVNNVTGRNCLIETAYTGTGNTLTTSVTSATGSFFYDAANYDFHLVTPGGNPAIDEGAALTLATDMDGDARGYDGKAGGTGTWDVGADELVGIPAAPTGFAGAPSSPTAILWTWTDVAGETFYKVHDSLDATIVTLGPNVASFLESNLAENTAYGRHVHAGSASGLSGASNAVTKYTKARDATLADFTSVPVSSSKVDISASILPNGSAGFSALHVERSPNGSDWTPLSVPAGVYAISDTGLAASTTYWYRIRYVNGDGLASAYSPSRSVTTYAPSSQVPAVPGGFAGSAQSTSSIQWTWSDVSDEQAYHLHTETHGVIATTAANATSHTDSGLGENTRVWRHVHAVNGAGAGGSTSTLSRYTKVHDPTPSDFSLTVVSSSRIDVTIVPPPNSTSGNTGVTFERSTDGTNWTPAVSIPYTYSDTGLTGNTNYQYRIRYQNGDGVSTALSIIKNATTPATPPPPAAPGSLAGTAQSQTSILWSWGDVSGETGFELHDDAHSVKGSTSVDVVTYTESGLSENAPYWRHVHAVNGSTKSTASTGIVKYTLVHNPLPAEFELTPVSSTQINVTVTPPPNPTAGSTRVQIERSLDQSAWSSVALTSPYYAADTGLAPNTTYYYRIRFANGDLVYSSWSSSKSVGTPNGPPATPTGLGAVAQGTSSIRWYWTDVAGETGYELHDEQHNVKGLVAANVVEFIETGLSENAPAKRHLHAVNTAGSSGPSTALVRYTTVHDPVPADFAVTAASGTTVEIRVTPLPSPSDDVSVQIERSTDDQNWTVVQSMSTQYFRVDTGRQPSTLYYYRIKFQNVQLVSTAYSASKSVTTPAAPPPDACNLNTGTLTTDSIQWTWNNVASETGYVIHDDAHNVKATLAADVTSWTETGLIENTRYNRHVHAINASGEGPAGFKSVWTDVHTPLPTDWSVTAISPYDVELAALPPPNNPGCGALSAPGVFGNLIPQISTDNVNWSYLASTPGGFIAGYRYTAIWLLPATTYYFRIAYASGDTSSGSGGRVTPFSASKSVTTLAGPPRVAPNSFGGTAQTTTSIQWTWTNVASETGFEIHDNAHSVKGSVGVDVLSWTETGLSENTRYERHVHAVNASGAGPASVMLQRFTHSRQAQDADFQLIAVSTTQIDVVVALQPNSQHGSSGVVIERSLNGSTWTNQVNQTGRYDTSYTGLTASTEYYVRVAYKNGDGTWAAWSNAKTITTPSSSPPPGATTPNVNTTWVQSTTSIQWTWYDVANDTGYEIHDQAHNVVGTTATNVVTFTETGLSENTKYWRHVHAIGASGSSNASAVMSKYTWVRNATLDDMTLTATSPYSVEILVNPPPNPYAGSTGFALQQSSDGTNWSSVGGIGYVRIVNNLTPGATYWYRLQYSNGDSVESAWTTGKQITLPAGVPYAPGAAGATAQSTSSIQWNWANVTGETGFDVHEDFSHALKASTAADVLSVVEGGLEPNRRHWRHVHATNASGSSWPSSGVSRVTFVPDLAAADFTVTARSASTIEIWVATPPNGGWPGYELQRSADGTNWSNIFENPPYYTKTDTNLLPSTLYYYRARWVNWDGAASAWTTAKSATTFVGATTPGSWTGTVQSTTSIQWTWTDSTGETGYEIHDDAHNVLASLPANSTSWTESTLTENTRASRHLHALSPGGNPATSTVAKTTFVHNPVATDFTLVVISSSQIDIVVTPPPNPWAGTTGMIVQRSTNGTSWSGDLTPSQSYVYNDTGRTGGTLYYYRVRYDNQDGTDTAWSPTKTATTPVGSLATPGSWSGTAQSMSSILWSWTDVAGETGYTVHNDAHAVVGTTGANVLSFTESGLSENTPIWRHAHAFDPVTLSSPTATHQRYTLIHDATTADFSIVVVSPTLVNVVVTPPPNATGNSTMVTFQRSTDGTNWGSDIVTGTYSYADSTVVGGTTYWYRIRFRNGDFVYSAWSPARTVTPATAIPAPPGGFNGTALSTSSLQWSWTDVAEERNYELHDVQHALVQVLNPNVVVTTETSLAENTRYSRHVHATNELGASGSSGYVGRYTLVHEPTIADFFLTTVSPTQIDVAVVAPPNGLSGSTALSIQRSLNGTDWTDVVTQTQLYSFSDMNLASATLYYYRIQFFNGDGIATGWSAARTRATLMAPAITTPSKKTRNTTPTIAGTAVNGTTVNVYFNGVLKATGTISGGTWSVVAAATPEGTYTVTARAAVGGLESGDSAPITVTVDTTAPAAPGNVRTTAFNNTIDVEWDASSSSDVAGYNVYRKTGVGGTWALLNTTGMVRGTKYRDTSPLNGTTYYYRVTAVDDATND